MLKSDLHTHCRCKTEKLDYTSKELIKNAAKLGYEVLAITNHNYNQYDKVKWYAKKHGILLIPGVEINIGMKHVVILNTKKGENLKNYRDLEKLKQEGVFLLAPHAFFPTLSSMRMTFFMKHKHLFDALEYSFFFTKKINFNNKIIKMSKKYHLPVVATSDCHYLENLDRNFTMIDADKNIDSVLEAIRKNKIKLHTEPLPMYKFVKIGFATIISGISGIRIL